MAHHLIENDIKHFILSFVKYGLFQHISCFTIPILELREKTGEKKQQKKTLPSATGQRGVKLVGLGWALE